MFQFQHCKIGEACLHNFDMPKGGMLRATRYLICLHRLWHGVLEAKAAPCSGGYCTRSVNHIPKGNSSYGAPGTEARGIIAPRLTRIEGMRPSPHG